MGVRVRVGFQDTVGVHNGQNFPSGAFGAHGASGAFSAHGLLRRHLWQLIVGWRPPSGGGGGVVGVLGPSELPPPGSQATAYALELLCTDVHSMQGMSGANSRMLGPQTGGSSGSRKWPTAIRMHVAPSTQMIQLHETVANQRSIVQTPNYHGFLSFLFVSTGPCRTWWVGSHECFRSHLEDRGIWGREKQPSTGYNRHNP